VRDDIRAVEQDREPINRIRAGVVVSIDGARPGAVELTVRVEGADAAAIAYPHLTGPVGPGDHVVLNTTAVELGLGTGGFLLVMAVEGRETGEVPAEAPGWVMKARYTPVQVAVASVEQTHRDLLEGSPGLRGTPVVVAPLHSMLAPIAAGAHRAGQAPRIVYVMTDGAALPGGFSRLVPRLLGEGLLQGWVTCGQAFGGDLEAVTIWSGLLAAVEVLEAEVVVVTDGPGNLGTDTTWGVSALTGGHAVDAAATLGGRPIPALRISFAEARERHRVLSHHSVTILRDVVAAEDLNVAVPVLPEEQRTAVWEALRGVSLEERHHLVETDGRPALEELAARGIEIRSMGRGVRDDPAFFLAAGAAGVLAGRLAASNRRWRATTQA
jgi:hypothetical protein